MSSAAAPGSEHVMRGKADWKGGGISSFGRLGGYIKQDFVCKWHGGTDKSATASEGRKNRLPKESVNVLAQGVVASS